jgi:hypothetical protein
MKTLHLTIIIISFSLVIQSINAEPVGAPSMSFSPFRLHLQKTEYKQGDTLIAQVEGLGGQSTGNALIKITPKNDDNDTNAIYEQTVQLINGWYEFKYNIPLMSPNTPYSYYVKVYELGSNIPSDKALFFTMENASKIIISKLNVDKKVGPDRNLNFEFKISDGLGNGISSVSADASIPYESCNIGSDQLTTNLYLIKSSGLTRGNITLPEDFESGMYHLYVFAYGENGYQPMKEQVTFEFFNNTSYIKFMDLKAVDPNYFIPYEPSTRNHSLYISGHIVTVESNNRFCGYDFVPEEKRLTIHVAREGYHQFMRLVIPYDLLSGNMYVLGDDVRLNFDSASSANGTIIALDHMFVYPDVSVIGTRAIPEFPSAVPALLIGIVSIIAFYRIKFGK